MRYQPQKKFMNLAIQEAINSVSAGEYPVGAVITKGKEVIAKSETRTHRNIDPSAHAELLVIRSAASVLRTRKLHGCVLYTTHEPCPMCTTVALFACVDGIVFGTSVRDAKEYGLQKPQWKWKWVDIPISTIVEKSNCQSFLCADFMKDKCRKLFDMAPF